MTTCAACSRHCDPDSSAEYQLGPLRGVLCGACQESLSGAVGRWMGGRIRELQRAQSAAMTAIRTARLLEAEGVPRRVKKARRAA